jgi:hypothetical protein
MLSRLRVHLPHWRRALRRRRRLLAVLAVAAAVAALLPAVLPPSSRGVAVVVADTPLAAGTVLAAEHLRTAQIAPELVPEGTAQEIEQVLGRTTLHPLDAGAPLLPGALEAPGVPVVPEGSALMAVPVPEVLVPHLRPGTAIELLSTDPSRFAGTGIRAHVVEVVAAESSAGALAGAAVGTAQALVTVERAQAGDMARALGDGTVVVSVIG